MGFGPADGGSNPPGTISKILEMGEIIYEGTG